MYIAPTSVIRLLKGVPLDPKYQHTLYFEDKEQQRIYFAGKLHKSIMDGTYQRVNVGVTRFNQKADELYNCNYMMFQNGSYGDKWFYAFITKIEYVNDAASNVYFEIDVMQTWLFDIELKRCMVEREHSLTDNIGDNIVSENVDMGYYVNNAVRRTNLMNSYTCVVATAFDPNGDIGGKIGGTFTGLKYIGRQIDDSLGRQAILDYLMFAQESTAIESIAALFIMPTKFFTTGEDPVIEDLSWAKVTEYIGNYRPKNKKLLTYPYNFLYVHNSSGLSAVYKYELFENDVEVEFQLSCAMGCNPEIVMSPVNYNGSVVNIDEKISMSDFPQVGYSTDSYKAWLAQQSGTAALINVGASAIGAAAGLATGNALGAAMGVMGVASSVNSVVQGMVKPDQAKGSLSSNTLVGTKQKDFYLINKQITDDYARIIDGYFDMFGYATNRIKVPNIGTRPHWNYVKTMDCVAVGNCPSDDLKQVCSIYDKGVTFWKNPSEVGNYNLDNSPE